MSILSENSVRFISNGLEKVNIASELVEMFNSPDEFAENYKMELTPEIKDDLLKVQEIRIETSLDIEDEVNVEILSFLNVE